MNVEEYLRVKMKLVEIAAHPFGLFEKFWIQNLKLPIEWSSIKEWDESIWKKIEQENDAVLLGSDMLEKYLISSRQKPKQILEMQQLDALVKTENKLWPQSFLRESLRQLILKTAPNLKCDHIGYITGQNDKTRVAVSVLVQFGYSNIILIVGEDNDYSEQKENWERSYFGVNFKWIKNTDLTLQQNDGSILINTENLVDHKELLEDLSYLNFLNRDGLVVDLSIFPLKNHLRDEAAQLKVRNLPGHIIYGMSGFLLLKSLGINQNEDEYMKNWCDFINLEQQNQSKV